MTVPNVSREALQYLGYQQITGLSTLVAQSCAIPANVKMITFTCETVMIRWLPKNTAFDANGNQIISTTYGNPLPVSSQDGQFEYIWQNSQPLSFISQGDTDDTTLTSIVNINYWG